MKQEIVKKLKIESGLALLFILLIAVILSAGVILIENKFKEKNAQIEILKKDNKLKDSLYIYCNGELSKISNDPIYQYYIQNDITASE